jgi:hypothetical protein
VTYGSSSDMPLYGPGQGSMCSPLFWILCYWLIVESFDPSIPVAQYISACKSISVQITVVSFVDNTGLGVTSSYKWNSSLSYTENSRHELTELVNNLTTIAQHWERLLFTTGGALNLTKSFWYSMTWNWKPRFLNTPLFFQRVIGGTPPDTLECKNIKDVLDHHLLVCSDGSYCPKTFTGSHCWVIGDHVSMISQGAGPTDGHANLLSSYRTELSGIIAALYIIYRICDYYHLDSGKATIFCDKK